MKTPFFSLGSWKCGEFDIEVNKGGNIYSEFWFWHISVNPDIVNRFHTAVVP